MMDMNMRREDIKTFDFDHLLQTMRVMQYFINLNLMSFYFCYMRFNFFFVLTSMVMHLFKVLVCKYKNKDTVILDFPPFNFFIYLLEHSS